MFRVKPRTVRGWIDEGCPVAVRGGGRGNPNLFDMAAVQEWRSNVAVGGPLDLTAERAMLTKVQRQEAEIRVRRALGELVPIVEVGQFWSDQIGAARAKLLALPTKAAPAVAACTGLEEIKAVIENMIREALEDVAGDGIPRSRDGGSLAPAAGADG